MACGGGLGFFSKEDQQAILLILLFSVVTEKAAASVIMNNWEHSWCQNFFKTTDKYITKTSVVQFRWLVTHTLPLFASTSALQQPLK